MTSLDILLMLCVLRTRNSSLEGLLALGLEACLEGAQDFDFCCLRRDLKMERSSPIVESPE